MISVVVPTYNEEKNIVICLKSILNQTLAKKEYEIIVVDGHSKDNTVKMAKRYADKVIMQKSKGVGGARNDGVSVARGEIIATTDADCIVHHDWLERIKEHYNDKELVFVSGRVNYMTNVFYYKFIFKIMTICSIISVPFFYIMAHIQCAMGCNSSIRKDVFKKIGGYKNITVLDDYEITLRAKKFGKLKYDSKLCVNTSTRRMEKDGILKVNLIWGINGLRLLLGKDVQNIEYGRKDYR